MSTKISAKLFKKLIEESKKVFIKEYATVIPESAPWRKDSVDGRWINSIHFLTPQQIDMVNDYYRKSPTEWTTEQRALRDSVEHVDYDNMTHLQKFFVDTGENIREHEKEAFEYDEGDTLEWYKIVGEIKRDSPEEIANILGARGFDSASDNLEDLVDDFKIAFINNLPQLEKDYSQIKEKHSQEDKMHHVQDELSNVRVKESVSLEEMFYTNRSEGTPQEKMKENENDVEMDKFHQQQNEKDLEHMMKDPEAENQRAKEFSEDDYYQDLIDSLMDSESERQYQLDRENDRLFGR